MIRRPPRSTLSSSSAASDVYKRQDDAGDRTGPPRRRGRASGLLHHRRGPGRPRHLGRPGGPVGHRDALLRRAAAVGDRRVWLSPAVRGRQRRAVPGDQSALPEKQRGVDLPCRDRVLGGATRGSDDGGRFLGVVGTLQDSRADRKLGCGGTVLLGCSVTLGTYVAPSWSSGRNGPCPRWTAARDGRSSTTVTSNTTVRRSTCGLLSIVAAVVEFVRFGASRDWCAPAVAGRLSSRTELRFIPRGMERGERTDTPVVQRRAVRRRRVERPPATLTAGQVGAVVDACANLRDRFVVAALYATGLRLAELCGLHLADLHFVPSAVHLGCQVSGPHLHVVRREDNENRALAKSIWPRVMPVTTGPVRCHNAYRRQRDLVPAAARG